MAITQNTYTGDGSTVSYSFTFPYLEETDIKVSLNGVVTTAYTLSNATTVTFSTAPANGAAIRIYRDTNNDALAATFFAGSAIRAQDLNDDFLQNSYVTQEIKSRYVDAQAPVIQGNVNMGGYRITNMGSPISNQDAVTKNYVDQNLGNVSIPGHTRWITTATASQTTFSGAGAYGGMLAYTPTREQVYLNGALQQRNVDYTANDGVEIVFSSGLTAGDIVDVVCVNNISTGTVNDAANINYSNQFTGEITRTVAAKLADVISTKDFSVGTSGSSIALTAYTNNTYLQVESTRTVKLQCNPSTGDNFQDMCNWISSGHDVEAGGSLYLELADGLHNVSTYVDLFDGQNLDIRGTGSPTSHQITAISISPVSGNTYDATVTISTALPSYVVTGYAIGCQNVKGDNGAESINGAHIITSIAGDRLSFTFQYLSFGVVPTTPTTLDTTTTLGTEGCIVQVPKACLRVDSAGWDGVAREGFINCIDGGQLSMRNVAIAYNGTTSGHDILFAKGHNSSINLVDRVVVAGAGSFTLRLAYGAGLYANRGYFGAGITGRQVLQSIYSCDAEFVRCFLGCASEGALVPTVGSRFGTTQCVIASCDYALRPTYRDSTITFLNSRISHCDRGIFSQGNVEIDSLSVIQKCTDPIFITNGYVYGNPIISNNTNATITPFSNLGEDSGWHPQTSSTVSVTSIGPFSIKGATSGQQVAKFETADSTAATLASFERSGGAVAFDIRYITTPDVSVDIGTRTSHPVTFSVNAAEAARFDIGNRFLIGTTAQAGGALLQINGDKIKLSTSKTPASATDVGTTGDICWDANYIYVCTATSTWKRAALSTW